MVIKKKFTSETSHIVRNAVSEKCRYSLHGHSYKWFVTIGGAINDKTGMILDFKELSPIKDFIEKFDHATVFWKKEDPEIIKFFKEKFRRVLVMKKNTTAENMARLAFRFAKTWLKKMPDCRIVNVEVQETETGSAIADGCDRNDILIEDKNTK